MLTELDGDPGPVVDYGCGDAPYRPLIELSGHRYIAADLPGNPMADLILGSDGGIPLPSGKAGLVLSSQVLEHVPSPKKYLAEAFRVLRPGGYLLLSTHGLWFYHPHPQDLWRWTRAGLIVELQGSGFDILQTENVLGPLAAACQLLQDAVAPKLPKALRPFWRFLSQLNVSIMDRFTTRPTDEDAAVYVVLARKPAHSAIQER